MNEDVRAALVKRRSEGNNSDYVFVNPDTKKPPVELKRSFSTALRLAGIHDLHWHDLRHTFGTRLAEAGFSEATIAELMGHADAATTRDALRGKFTDEQVVEITLVVAMANFTNRFNNGLGILPEA